MSAELRGVLVKIVIKDDVMPYPEKKNTGQPLRDKAYNWVVARYKRNNHFWKKSDERVWGGFIYYVVDYIWLLTWIGLLWLIINSSLKRVGFEKTVFVVAIIFLIRLNSLIKQMVQLNKKF
jgi:hypothetical protein